MLDGMGGAFVYDNSLSPQSNPPGIETILSHYKEQKTS